MTARVATATRHSRNDPRGWGPARVVFATGLAVGSAMFLAAALGHPVGSGWLGFALCYGLIAIGSLAWIVDDYRGTTPGIKNHGNFHRNIQRRGWVGWLLFVVLAGFYTLYYWFHAYLEPATRLLDPLSELLRGVPADHWFMYSYLYSLAVLIMGVRMVLRYRHSRYQIFRTLSVTFFQLVLAFLVPAILRSMNQPEFYFTYFWPLLPKYLYPSGAFELIHHPGGWGSVLFVWAVGAILILTPLLTYYFGKRWYCSWVCGCGGLAETLGDPFRHLSDKRKAAWKFERWSIHIVLAIIILGTILLWVNHLFGGDLLGKASHLFDRAYGFLVMSVLAGAVGVSFYPIMGSRVWCRFFCPMAAILGIFQRYFSRFRITTNGGQCMSCGNCSTYCEMGIDVRSYAQRGANVVRASCVGCGICSAVCPRGVLNLENGKSYKDRFPGADRPLAELKRSLGS
jgi:ferredoxin-type protein NapH